MILVLNPGLYQVKNWLSVKGASFFASALMHFQERALANCNMSCQEQLLSIEWSKFRIWYRDGKFLDS